MLGLICRGIWHSPDYHSGTQPTGIGCLLGLFHANTWPLGFPAFEPASAGDGGRHWPEGGIMGADSGAGSPGGPQSGAVALGVDL